MAITAESMEKSAGFRHLATAAAALIFSLPCPAALAAGANTGSIDDPRLERCIAGLYSGYGSGIEEISCRADYNLPPAYLFSCMRKLRQGFTDTLDRSACVAFLESQTEKTRNGYVRKPVSETRRP